MIVNGDGLEPEARIELRRRMKLWLTAGAMLAILIGLFVWWLVIDSNHREQDRIVARYVLCTENEKIKAALRTTLRDRLEDNRSFLRANPNGIPSFGISGAQLRRIIVRDERQLRSLAPYPKGCAAFARDPARVNVDVPPTD